MTASKIITAVKKNLEAKGYEVKETAKFSHRISVKKNIGNNVVRTVIIQSAEDRVAENRIYVQFVDQSEDYSIVNSQLDFYNEEEENVTIETVMKKVNEALQEKEEEPKKIIGYFNQKGWTDIRSKRVYEQAGKFYLVRVEKRVGKVKPDFHVGGFAAHCSNQQEVWDNGVIVETSKPREVFKNEKGEFFTTYNPCKEYLCSPDRLESLKAQIIEEKAGKKVEFVYLEDSYTLIVYSLTKTGKRLTRKNILGKPESTCRYYYDYNF